MGVGVPQALRFFKESSGTCRLRQSWTWGRNDSESAAGVGWPLSVPGPPSGRWVLCPVPRVGSWEDEPRAGLTTWEQDCAFASEKHGHTLTLCPPILDRAPEVCRARPAPQESLEEG